MCHLLSSLFILTINNNNKNIDMEPFLLANFHFCVTLPIHRNTFYQAATDTTPKLGLRQETFNLSSSLFE